MSDLNTEDAKLVKLARSAHARSSADQAAAVRDTDGRTYVATSIALPSLSLSALQLAVAMAVSSGALDLEAAVVLGEVPIDAAGLAALRGVAPAAAVYFANPQGELITEQT